MNQKDPFRESKFETLTSKVFRFLQKAISIGKENFEHCKYSNGKHRRIAIAVANFKLVRWNKKNSDFNWKIQSSNWIVHEQNYTWAAHVPNRMQNDKSHFNWKMYR